MKKPVDIGCRAFQTAIGVLGRPWTGQILTALQQGPLRFRECSEKVSGIGDKILSARLRELEKRGIIARDVDPGPPVRVRYSLTRSGKGFLEVAEAIERWGRTLS